MNDVLQKWALIGFTSGLYLNTVSEALKLILDLARKALPVDVNLKFLQLWAMTSDPREQTAMLVEQQANVENLTLARE